MLEQDSSFQAPRKYHCVFCGEKIGIEEDDREQHVGRHMEEIAFSVVSKLYDESESCSDTLTQYCHLCQASAADRTFTVQQPIS